MGDVTTPVVPALATRRGIDIVAVGTWGLSTGEATFTAKDLADAVDAAQCPSVGPPVIKLGHYDPRYNPDATAGDGTPAVGRVINLALSSSNQKITGDFAGMPAWLGEVWASAYPNRSIEGTWDFGCQIGHVHPFVITAVALLGTSRPGVGVLNSIEDVAALYGAVAAAAAPTGRAWSLTMGGHHMPGTAQAAGTTTEDVRRSYYDQPGLPYSRWICEMQLDPPQLIVCDDATSKMYRVPVTIKGSEVTFGDAVEVEVEYVDMPANAAAPVRSSVRMPLLMGSRVSYATADDSRAGVTGPPAAAADDPADPPLDDTHAASDKAVTHSHPHSSYGSQGGDDTHDHMHAHAAGDGSHNHAHGSTQAAGPSKEGVRKVDFTNEQLATLRTRLGLAEDAELSPDQIMAALATPAPAGAPGTGTGTGTTTPPAGQPAGGTTAPAAPQPMPVAAGSGVPEGALVVDREVWDGMQARIQQGEDARREQLRVRRDADIQAAVKEGKFSVARVQHWARIYDVDPEGTRQVLAGLQAGVVPIGDIGSGGGAMGEELDDEFRSLFPPKYDSTGTGRAAG